MKKLILIYLLLILFIGLIAIDEIALTLKVKGKIDHHHQKSVGILTKGFILKNSDKLVSHDNSYAAIKFIDGGSLMKIFPNSVVVLEAEEQNKKMNKKISLESGKIFSKIKKKMGDYEIQTPSAVASVKGTEFLVLVRADGATTIFTFEGSVEVKNKKTGAIEIISKGQKTSINLNGSAKTEQFEIDELPAELLEEINDGKDTKLFEMQLVDPETGETKTLQIEFE